MGSQEELFDLKKDYYKVLGVEASSELENIKKAHAKLVMEFHPDRQGMNDKETMSKANMETKFNSISEAWAVLSKPELKKAYDNGRVQAGRHKLDYSYESSGKGASPIPEHTFSKQRDHYQVTVKKAASSTWQEKQMLDKYRTEKWQSLSLDKRKAYRARTVHVPGASMGGFVVFGAACFGIGFYLYKSQVPDKKTSGAMYYPNGAKR